MVAKSQSKYDEAIASLRRLIQQDPKNYRLYLELADCFYRKGDKYNALEIMEESQKQGVRNPYIIEFIEKLKT